ncbi:hypothetical protein IMG5_127900 [Ichthyophthirius multifiliis]|uniref:Nudix hydrolase domain-containing protein n=1 Tax=Ichthyophthirius multifiliis TaxID=5932 RepID=G0QVZ4_ICHMU|nr:hypothetical protein IMG5_127900 [Ichthyophthirius multifiliis]EGR30610.1 hypothetical protein IMG5_127900 [Ichthyophthirius multifiliis]|eukprot:XP_004032197.1 hypothetical protein IMG5_127900 [Ichthyophthirius multifiliis]
MDLPPELTEITNTIKGQGNEDKQSEQATYYQDLGAGERREYSELSKHFLGVDPNINDKRQLQYAACHRTYLLVKDPIINQFVFPTKTVLDREVLNEAKALLFDKMSEQKFTVYYNNVIPNLCVVRKFYEHELTNPLNKNLLGVKTFYYYGAHLTGPSYINNEMYSEYIWTPKMELQQHVSNEYYDKFIDILLNY